MHSDRQSEASRRRFVIVTVCIAAMTLIYETTNVYDFVNSGRELHEFLYAWRPAMLVASLSLLIIALSNTYYLQQLNTLTQQHTQEMQETRSRLVQAAAHELRNPMTGLKGVLAVLRRRIQAGRPVDNLMELIDTADHEVDRMAEFLNDFVDAFHVQQGQMELKLAPTRLAEVLFSAIQPFHALAEDEDRHLIFDDTQLNGVKVKGDAKRLEQVIRNLLSNAIKYSPKGSDIVISSHIKLNTVVVSVQDFGIGISEADLSQVFDCFYRVKGVAEHDPGGSGLGLYIARDVVARHGGRIWVDSEIKRSTTFHIELPLYRPDLYNPPITEKRQTA